MLMTAPDSIHAALLLDIASEPPANVSSYGEASFAESTGPGWYNKVDMSCFQSLEQTSLPPSMQQPQQRSLRNFESNSSVGSAASSNRDTLHHYSSTGSIGDGKPGYDPQDESEEHTQLETLGLHSPPLKKKVRGANDDVIPCGMIPVYATNPTAIPSRKYPKPSYSYSCLIALALKNSTNGKLQVSEIYNFMCENFPYFRTAPPGWKNSVRHNLSLNKCFAKIEIEAPAGHGRKACLWMLSPTKTSKMQNEIVKWRQKDPIGVKESLLFPEELDIIERGEKGMPNAQQFYGGLPDVVQHAQQAAPHGYIPQHHPEASHYPPPYHPGFPPHMQAHLASPAASQRMPHVQHSQHTPPYSPNIAAPSQSSPNSVNRYQRMACPAVSPLVVKSEPLSVPVTPTVNNNTLTQGSLGQSPCRSSSTGYKQL